MRSVGFVFSSLVMMLVCLVMSPLFFKGLEPVDE